MKKNKISANLGPKNGEFFQFLAKILFFEERVDNNILDFSKEQENTEKR